MFHFHRLDTMDTLMLMSNTPQIDLQIHLNPIKIPRGFLAEIYKLILKLVWKF